MFRLIYLVFLVGLVRSGPPPNCPSEIYCHGKLLQTVQMASLYPDSKTFVDMKIKKTPAETLSRFNKMMEDAKDKPTRSQIEEFVKSSFDPAGSEFQDWNPDDWVETPKFLKLIKDPELRAWASKLNNLWKLLGRKIKDDVKNNPEHYSIIYLPHPVIVPGGRFREVYYWDSFWIIRGLLLSEMFTTVKGMLSNFMTFVDRYGFIPNGGRVYYGMRSQPPLLIPMVKSYLDATHDFNFVKENIDTMEKEFQFWMNNRTVSVTRNGKNHRLARYADESSGPRPESYREDVNTAMIFKTDDKKEEFYSELKSAAESGWDFSSRWFIKGGSNHGNLSDVKTKAIIPVDLNSIIYWNAVILSDFFVSLNMPQKAIIYKKIAINWRQAVNDILWDDEYGSWFDYDTINNKPRNYFFPTNLYPLWTNCYDQPAKGNIADRVLSYLEENGIGNFPGGIPSSLLHTGEQWDLPNAWPPMQYIIIMGLDSSENSWAKQWAYQLASKWIQSNYKAFNETNAMFEKYDATKFGGHGGGGEYNIQLGFGWSNGVIMELLAKYGDFVTAQDEWVSEKSTNATNSAPFHSFLAFNFLFLIVCFVYVKNKCLMPS